MTLGPRALTEVPPRITLGLESLKNPDTTVRLCHGMNDIPESFCVGPLLCLLEKPFDLGSFH